MVGRVAGGELECPRLVDGSEVDREGVAGCDDAALARGAEPLVQLLHGGGKGGGSKRGAYQGASKFFNRQVVAFVDLKRAWPSLTHLPVPRG